jgi:cysteine desulfurase
MDATGDRGRRSLRFSFSRFNTEAQIDHAIEVVPKVIAKLRAMPAPSEASAVSSVATAR